MAVRQYSFESEKYGVITTGTIISQNSTGGIWEGVALDTDSKTPSYHNFSQSAIDSVQKARHSGLAPSEINLYLQDIATPFEDLNNPPEVVTEGIEKLEENGSWLWGGVWQGGCCIVAINDGVTTEIVIFHGLYNHDSYYQIVHETSGYRPEIEDYDNCCVVYRGTDDNASLSIFSMKDGKSAVVKQYKELSPSTGEYISVGHTKSIEDLNKTRGAVTIPIVNEVYHIFVIGYDDNNSTGGVTDPNGWQDDTTVNILPSWDKISGSWMGGGELEPQPNPEGTKPQGGNPTYIKGEVTFEPVTEEQFEIDGLNSGLVSIYNPTLEEIKAFTHFLFSGITEDISAFFKRLMSNPLDYVINLSMCHIKPPTQYSAEIKFGGVGSGVVSSLVSREVVVYDCGTVAVGGEFDTWQDYANQTSAKIHIPYCGNFDLDIDAIMNSSIKMEMVVDYLTGACVCQLYVTHNIKFDNDRAQGDEPLYEFTGNIFKQMPLSASDYRSAIQGILTAIGGVGAFASGNYVSGITSVASGVMNIKPNIQHSGKADANFGYLSHQDIFIEIIRPNPSLVDNYPYRIGYPVNRYYKHLRSFKGSYQKSALVIVQRNTFNANDINCTDEEKKMIINQLEEGVII